MLPVLQGEAAPPPPPPGAPALQALLCSAEVGGDPYLPGYFSPFSQHQEDDSRSLLTVITCHFFYHPFLPNTADLYQHF